MSSETKAPHSARQETDRSLLVERERTDDEMRKREVVVRGRSDSVVEQARERADDLLADARSKADETHLREGIASSHRGVIESDRAAEDSVVHEERATADQLLEDERAARLRALNALLRFERDQTDERLLVERARGDASLLARDNFMSMVAHDVRNLLGGIALGAALQIKSPSTDEAGQRNRKTSEKIQRLTARINRLMGDLFDVTSIESGRFSVEARVQDARSLITDAMDAFGSAASDSRLTLDVSVTPGVLKAKFDRDRVLQVLTNLLSNAIKFTPAHGSIGIAARAEKGEIHFSVSDSGQGIPEDQHEVIFERFWQVRKDDRRGLGLGLFISKCIVEAHQGRLWVESVPGKGSTFHFTLPAA
jgi:signal transduction histidine kinase